MVNLDELKDPISRFIDESVQNFSLKYGVANSIGIYVCPWSGWISCNFNLNKSIKDCGNNCPDFEFVEFELFDLPELASEFESESPSYMVNRSIVNLNHNLGNEGLNKIIFHFLLPVIAELKDHHPQPLLLQLLDSKYYHIA